MEPEIAIVRPSVPFVPDYCVVTASEAVPLDVLLDTAVRVARRESQRRFGDPRCYSLLCNAARTRRCPWPHVHIVLAPDFRAKRRAMVFLLLKHVTRVTRWPLVRYLRGR